MKIKKVFNLKELYYFEIIFWFFLIRPTDPTFRVEGDGKRNILLGWPKYRTRAVQFRISILNLIFANRRSKVFGNLCRAELNVGSSLWTYLYNNNSKRSSRIVWKTFDAELLVKGRSAPQLSTWVKDVLTKKIKNWWVVCVLNRKCDSLLSI